MQSGESEKSANHSRQSDSDQHQRHEGQPLTEEWLGRHYRDELIERPENQHAEPPDGQKVNRNQGDGRMEIVCRIDPSANHQDLSSQEAHHGKAKMKHRPF